MQDNLTGLTDTHRTSETGVTQDSPWFGKGDWQLGKLGAMSLSYQKINCMGPQVSLHWLKKTYFCSKAHRGGGWLGRSIRQPSHSSLKRLLINTSNREKTASFMVSGTDQTGCHRHAIGGQRSFLLSSDGNVYRKLGEKKGPVVLWRYGEEWSFAKP